MRRWLDRLALSFVIIGCVLIWEGYRILQGRNGPATTARICLYFIGAGISFALGVAGIRQRHRRHGDD
jgi:hypothetical protein